MTNRRQKIAHTTLLAFLLGVLLYFFINERQFETRVPNLSERSGAISAGTEFANIRKAVEHYRFRIRRDPGQVDNYVHLAQLYLQEARITGRHHEYTSKVEQLLEEALQRQPAHFDAMVTKASALLIQHQFEEALTLVEKALAQSSFNAFAWGVKSDALKELGRYDEAVQACDRMLSIRPDLRAYSRAAHLREIHGDLNGAREAMRLAVNAGIVGMESHAWCAYQLGTLYLKEGKPDTAASIFNTLLKTRPNYAYGLKGLSEVHRQKEEYQQAIQRMLQAFELAPEHEFLEDLVGLYKLSGDIETARVLIESVLEGFREHERQGWNVNLEFARFCAANNLHLQEALARIESEYRIRPNNTEVQQTYEQLLHKNNLTGSVSLAE